MKYQVKLTDLEPNPEIGDMSGYLTDIGSVSPDWEDARQFDTREDAVEMASSDDYSHSNGWSMEIVPVPEV